MKAKNILMSLLLVMGAIAAKAAGYPPELALVSQPVMVYNANSITVYYDVENIGDYTYRGSVYLYLSPDEGYYYADEWVKVRPGRIKRIAIDIPAYRIRKGHAFTIMPYYELDDELYSFTTFEYFEPITFFWEGPRNERWVVINVGPCPHSYHRPGDYRYYYDGFRPPMPPDHGPATPPRPMDPKHHTYGYHKEHGGYPAHHFDDGHGPKPEHGSDVPKPHDGDTPKPNDNGGATVRPNTNAGSMSGGNSSSVKPNNPASNGSNSGSNSNRRSSNSSNSNVSRPSSNGSSSGNVSRPSSNSGSNRPSGTSNSSSGRKGNGKVNRSNSSSSSSGTTRSNSSSSSKSNSVRKSASSSSSRSSSSGSSRR